MHQWEKNCPRKPSLERGKQLKQLLDDLNKRKADLEKELRFQVEQLKQLGKPRSLLNPFGVSAEVIDSKRIEIWATKMDMGDVERELSHAISNFKQWQKEARTSAAWQENPQTI